MTREPLSMLVARVFEHCGMEGYLTINGLIRQTEGRGLYLVIILLCLPFLAPMPIPMLSSLVALFILSLVVRLALNLPPQLPAVLGDRSIRIGSHQRIIKASMNILRFIENTARPRGEAWLNWKPVRWFNLVVMMLLCLLLFLPFPPLFLFTNAVPSYALILMCASLMEEDGIMVWLGYGATVVAAIYIGFIYAAAYHLFVNYFDRVMEVIRSWF